MFQKIKNTKSSKLKLWTAYHTLATQEVGTLWNQLCSSVENLEKDPLLIQSVARSILNFGCDTKNVTDASTNDVNFSRDELNALRYACGYVPLKLLQKYEKKEVKSLISLRCALEKWLSLEINRFYAIHIRVA